jgi:hypothetical protein
MMEKTDVEKILRRFVSPVKRDFISRFLDSNWIDDKPLSVRNLYFLNKNGEEYLWRLPSSGSAHIDLALGEELAIDFMHYATTFEDSNVRSRNAYPFDLLSMVDKMKEAPDACHYLIGFQLTLFRFLGYALHDPGRYAAVMERIAKLNRHKIDERIRMVLDGAYPPDLLAF